MRWAIVGIAQLGALMACGDDDPRYGPPGGIAGREVDFGIDAAAASPEAAPTDKPATTLFAELFATLVDGSGKTSSCLPCHGTSQKPVFMLATAEETRAEFLRLGYDDLATSRFYLRGEHTGPDLKTEQRILAQQWAAAEHGAGGVTDAGAD